jgi:hypothetical protein
MSNIPRAAVPLAAFVLAALAPVAATREWPRLPAASAPALEIPADAAAMRIDAAFDEEIWARAAPITEFLQRDPREGEPTTHATEARILFDQAALYVAVRASEPEPDRIVGVLTRRDDQSPSDWLRVVIDSYRDRRTGYEFAVNAAGVKQDRYWFGDTNTDPSWDAVWDVAVARDASGWRAEFRIPFSQLRYHPSASTFGFALVRTVAHVNETASWPLLARSASGYVSSFGELTGLRLSGTGRRLEVVPYVLGQATSKPVAADNPLASSPGGDVSAGVDLKYNVGSGMTLTGSINPDFGQVEADPAVVNLGAFETFFAERRPFFVEGSGNFSFNIDCEDERCTGLFYSRRIGRNPQRVASAPADGYAVQPANTTILGATKVTGRVAGFSVGVLNAITARENARVTAGPLAEPSTTPVEPAASYTVARVSRELANQSRVSFMLTSTNRSLTDELRFLPGAATTGGVDADVRFGGGAYSVTGYWAGSHVRGSAAAIDRLQRNNVHSFQRPDADHLAYDPTRTALSGHAGAVSVRKISGQTTRFSSGVSYKSPGFEINDLGFQQRADEVSQYNWFQIRSDRPGRFVRSKNVNLNQWSGWNTAGDRRYSGGNVNTHWTLTNNWSFGTGFNVQAGGFADRLTRGGPGGLTPASVSQWGYMNTDPRRAVSVSFNGSWAMDRHGSRNLDLSPSVTWRPSRALMLAFGAGLSRNINDSQWVTNLTGGPEPHYVFARIDQTSVRVSARVNYTVTPTLTVQVYAQPFVSAGAYSGYKELADGLAARYEDRYRPFAYGGSSDFNFRSFRTTNVVRWEYRPGSALFVVWQQGREGVAPLGTFGFGRDFGAAFGAPATNVFLVKASRWF